MLVVLLEEHRKNFRRLSASADALSRAGAPMAGTSRHAEHLLRFYAAEVGLKYLLNEVLKIPFKHELSAKGPVYVEKFSHRLSDMVAELKIPAGRIPPEPASPRMCVGGYDDGSGGQKFEVSAAHEAWRYGLTIQTADEALIVGYVGGLIAYLESEIAA